MERLTVSEYFKQPETTRPMELVYGVVREPPAPRYGHQSLVTHLAAILDHHVRARGLGEVCVSPVDVVLDESGSLVVQPDIVFVAREHLDRVRDRIFGAPDLVIEVLSPATAHRDRTTKLDWYRRYGVAECWLIDKNRRSVEIIELGGVSGETRRVFAGDEPLRSRVLPDWTMGAASIFD